jgi:hypothetical protein
MAFSLYKTSKHSRVWREVVDGLATAISKTSVVPMHYESVFGSGDYDTPIDLVEVATDDADVDGFVVEENLWHWGLQTAAVPELDQSAQGTTHFGGIGGANVLRLKCTSMGYLHHPTRIFTIVGSAFDYTAASPTFTKLTRNLGTNADVPDLTITVSNFFEWTDLWSEGVGQDTEITIDIRGGKLGAFNRFDKAVKDELVANWPVGTTPSETEFGHLFELDVSDIPRVYQNDVLLSWDDDFDDDAGDIYLRDGSDNLIAIIPKQSGPHGGVLQRPLRARFWKDTGVNYMFIGLSMSDFDVLMNRNGDYYASFYIGMDLELLDHGHTAYQTYYNAAWPEYNYPPQYELSNWVDTRVVTLGSNWRLVNRFGIRFRPELPFNASITGPGEYAKLRMYEDLFSAEYAGKTGIEMLVHADVYSADQPLFATDFVDSPEPGSNFRLSRSSSSEVLAGTDPHVPYSALTPIDISGQIEEVTGLAKWLPGNGLRLRVHPLLENPPEPYAYDFIGMSTYNRAENPSLTPVLDLVYTERSSARKPGFDDSPGLRNRRNSRLAGKGANDASFRLGKADIASVGTADNKNRNRFS